ncbi:ATP-dependent Clp protease adaptor ClpS, partial [Myxococcota bacterium]|nr:ATP-dependent Clp protease adaptor ClpS [Myxococcota bacterium]
RKNSGIVEKSTATALIRSLPEAWATFLAGMEVTTDILGRDNWTDRPSAASSRPPNGPRHAEGGVEGGLATEERKKVARPDRYKVLLYNDDFTPMEFVVMILEKIFSKTPSAATQIMLQIHRSGLGVAGVFVLEIAETKVAAVHQAAEGRGYPLRAGVEKE